MHSFLSHPLLNYTNKKTQPICIHGHFMYWYLFGKYANQLQFGPDPMNTQSGSPEPDPCFIWASFNGVLDLQYVSFTLKISG